MFVIIRCHIIIIIIITEVKERKNTFSVMNRVDYNWDDSTLELVAL